MTYQEFKQAIAQEQPIPDYYEQLLEHSTEILTDTVLTSKQEVAKQLGLNYQKFTHIVQLLKAHANSTRAESTHIE